MDSKTLKAIIIALTILYILSPIDCAPGPLDDIVVYFLSHAICTSEPE